MGFQLIVNRSCLLCRRQNSDICWFQIAHTTTRKDL